MCYHAVAMCYLALDYFVPCGTRPLNIFYRVVDTPFRVMDHHLPGPE